MSSFEGIFSSIELRLSDCSKIILRLRFKGWNVGDENGKEIWPAYEKGPEARSEEVSSKVPGGVACNWWSCWIGNNAAEIKPEH